MERKNKDKRARIRRSPRHDVTLHVEPGKIVTWSEMRTYGPHSFGLDGYCKGPPRHTADRLRRCINHHEGVDRLATRSTAMQSIMLLQMGLVPLHTVEGRFTANLFVNDCDQDVIWATYALMHPEDIGKRLFMPLVRLADMLDTTMGFFPVKERWHLLRRLLWISEPYTVARAEGRLNPKGHAPGGLREEMERIIRESHRRIRETLYRRGREIEPDARFEVIDEHGPLKFIHEIGSEARLGVAEEGVSAFVGIVGPRSDEGPFRYVAHRKSELVTCFDPAKFFRKMNKLEGRDSKCTERWGGGETGGGSPRENGSPTPPEKVWEVAKTCLQKPRQ